MKCTNTTNASSLKTTMLWRAHISSSTNACASSVSELGKRRRTSWRLGLRRGLGRGKGFMSGVSRRRRGMMCILNLSFDGSVGGRRSSLVG